MCCTNRLSVHCVKDAVLHAKYSAFPFVSPRCNLCGGLGPWTPASVPALLRDSGAAAGERGFAWDWSGGLHHYQPFLRTLLFTFLFNSFFLSFLPACLIALFLPPSSTLFVSLYSFLSLSLSLSPSFFPPLPLSLFFLLSLSFSLSLPSSFCLSLLSPFHLLLLSPPPFSCVLSPSLFLSFFFLSLSPPLPLSYFLYLTLLSFFHTSLSFCFFFPFFTPFIFLSLCPISLYNAHAWSCNQIFSLLSVRDLVDKLVTRRVLYMDFSVAFRCGGCRFVPFVLE